MGAVGAALRVGVAAAIVAGGLAAACSDSGGSATPAMAADAAAPDAGAACLAPTEAPSSLDGFLSERVAKLSGQTEIAPGVRLADRATPERRRAAAEYLRAELAALGLEASLVEYATGANVVGRLAPIGEGTGEWIVIGAHYDSVPGSPGASDNASGVTAVLAVTRMLAALPCRDRGVMVVMFDEEEIGLVGSTAFAAGLSDAGTAISAVHTVDQVAWDADGDRRFELEGPTPTLLAEYRESAAVLGVTVERTGTLGSDHHSFRLLGYPAVGITEEFANKDTTPFAHDGGDSTSTLNVAFHALSVRLVAHVVARQLGAE